MGSASRVDPADLLIIDSLREVDDGAYVSGAHLADELGISRAAVGKRVALLREQGFSVDAVPRLGYQLVGEPDRLHPLVVQGRLNGRSMGASYRYLDEVDSTNAELAKAAVHEQAAAGSVVLAEKQRRGRGRLGRSWTSGVGQNLTFSVLLRPQCPPSGLPPISLAAAVAVARGIEPFLGYAPIVKWPNDLLAPDGKKLCGILTELAAELDQVQHVVVGVGLNVNQTRFPKAIANLATSIKAQAKRSVSRVDVFVSVLESLEHWIGILFTGEDGVTQTLEEWMSLAPWIGQKIDVVGMDQQFSAVASGIDTTGALVLEMDGEEATLLSADIRIRI